MTATEAKLESAWRNLPPIIRAKIERGTEWGEWVEKIFITYMVIIVLSIMLVVMQY